MDSHLFLCSTPLHLLNAIAIADHQSSDCHLCLIDQPNTDRNPYFNILTEWKDSPFKTTHIFEGRIKGLKKKRCSRKKTFARLKELIETIKPISIYTGNDRRIEFQFGMHCARQINSQTVGVYMDEGTYTYIGRQASASFSDQYIDNLIKKLAYGYWWKNPPTVGASSWISKVYAAFPELVHPLLKQKEIKPLQSVYINNNSVNEFCSNIFRFFGETPKHVAELDILFTLPHESIIDSIPGYRESIESIVSHLSEENLRIGIKYHPRNSEPDILNAKEKTGIYLLPHQIPFEAILPNLKDCIVVGDVSSTLINSKFLIPDCATISIANPNAPSYREFCDLFNQIGVKMVNSSNLQAALTEIFNHA